MQRTPVTGPSRSPGPLMSAPSGDPPIAAPLARRFEAIVFDWDGVAAPDRPAAATGLRRLVEDACEAGIVVAIVGEGASRPSTVS